MKTTKKLKAISVCAAVVGMCVIGGTLTGFVPADADTVNATDAVAAVQQVAPAAVSNPDGSTPLDPSAGVAVESHADGVAATVPIDAADGVTVGSGPSLLRIGLPYSDQASGAAPSQVPGVVVYDNRNGSSTVPVIGDDGGVRINTVIENASAPREYRYPIELPGGAELTLNEDGSVSAANTDKSYEAQVAAPWARDANANAVATHYEVDGNILTQVVDFDATTAFPVVADPTVITTTYTYSRADVERMWNTYQTLGTICNLIPGLN